MANHYNVEGVKLQQVVLTPKQCQIIRITLSQKVKYCFGFLHGAFSRRAYNIFLVVGHTFVEIFLLINYFFDVMHTSNRMFLTGKFLLINDSFFIPSSIKH